MKTTASTRDGQAETCTHPAWPILSCDQALEQIGIGIFSLSRQHGLSFRTYQQLLDGVNEVLQRALHRPEAHRPRRRTQRKAARRTSSSR